MNMIFQRCLHAILLISLSWLPSCKEEGDDFSGPTAQALNETFGTGFGDETLLDVSIDGNKNIYVTSRTKIFKLDATGKATVFAGSGEKAVKDGQGTAASFNNIDLISFDPLNNLIVMDYQVIRKVSPGGQVTSIQPTVYRQIGVAPFLNYPLKVKDFDVLDPKTPPWFLNAVEFNSVMYVSLQTVIVTISGNEWGILAGGKNLQQGFVDGKGNTARFSSTNNIELDALGENLIVSDQFSLRVVSISDSTVVTLTGSEKSGHTDGTLSEASYNSAHDFEIDSKGNYYLCDNDRIRKISNTGTVATIAGPIKPDGSVLKAGGLALNEAERILYVVDMNKAGKLIKIDLSKID